MTEFKTGKAGDGQDVGNNILLQNVNEKAREAVEQDRGRKLEQRLHDYLRSKALRSPTGGAVLDWFELSDMVVLVFEDDFYFAISVENDYDGAEVYTGGCISISDGIRCGVMSPVMDVYKEYKEWQQKDVERREKESSVSALRRLKSLYSTRELKNLLGIEE
jgi:hypothetical protein